jgi:hypothetical protein
MRFRTGHSRKDPFSEMLLDLDRKNRGWLAITGCRPDIVFGKVSLDGLPNGLQSWR